MFDFLKKKLKIFEKNIEAEIESELKKEEKLEKRLQAEPEPQKQSIQTISPVKTSRNTTSNSCYKRRRETSQLRGNERSVFKNQSVKKKRNEKNKSISRLRKASKVSCNVFFKPGKASKRQSVLRRNHHGRLMRVNSMNFSGI